MFCNVFIWRDYSNCSVTVIVLQLYCNVINLNSIGNIVSIVSNVGIISIV